MPDYSIGTDTIQPGNRTGAGDGTHPQIDAYQDAVRACALLAGLLLMHDLPGLLRAIERADAIGPLVDPTLWRDKGAAMLQDKELLEAALPLWRYAKAARAGGAAQNLKPGA